MAEEIAFDSEKGVFQSWKTREGAPVRAGAVLLSYKESGSTKQVKIPAFGVIQTLADLKEGDELRSGQFLASLKRCEHPVVMKDLCADCGEDLRQKHGLPGERVVQTQARVAMIHHIPELQITPEEAKNYGTADEQNLLRQRKLVLLVDLDQTLIHTTNEDVIPNLKDVFHFQLYGSTSPWYHTRLRPHTRHFLEAVSKLYELHICTFGARLYAHTVAKILDPEGKLFGQRILSREECFDANLKIANLKALFPCGDRLVCIIDDREDVWNFAPNVIHVKPYRYFKHTGDINAPPGFSKNGQSKGPPSSEAVKEPGTTGGSYERQEERKVEESDSDNGEAPGPSASGAVSDDSTLTSEPVASPSDGKHYESPEAPTEAADHDDDDYLYHLEDILSRIHTAFYQMHDQLPAEERPPDLKSVVPYVKNKVLKSCNIVFSGVVPTNVPIEKSAIYKAAMAFGATVQKDVVLHHGKHNRRSCTTHLVAAKWGTAKVYQARKAGSAIKIVTPQWLWCCVERWEREDERVFMLSKDSEPFGSRRRERRKDDDEDGFVEIVEPENSTAESGSAFPPPDFGDDQEESATGDDADLEYEPDSKRSRDYCEALDNYSVSSTSSSSKSKSDEDPLASGDEEMAEELEKQFQ